MPIGSTLGRIKKRKEDCFHSKQKEEEAHESHPEDHEESTQMSQKTVRSQSEMDIGDTGETQKKEPTSESGEEKKPKETPPGISPQEKEKEAIPSKYVIEYTNPATGEKERQEMGEGQTFKLRNHQEPSHQGNSSQKRRRRQYRCK